MLTVNAPQVRADKPLRVRGIAQALVVDLDRGFSDERHLINRDALELWRVTVRRGLRDGFRL